jgi:isoamylase
VTRRWVGRPYPLGAVYDGLGTNFSVFSSIAEGVELCLFGDDGRDEQRIVLQEVDGYCWHAYIPEIAPAQRYGFRVHGPWDPSRGAWCNPAKLLLDPYAKAHAGTLSWHQACFPYRWGEEFSREDSDSAPYVPRSVVHDPVFDWGNDRHPDTPLHETIIYEVHVKGFTQRHPGVPEELRGTYAGLGHPAAIEHLLDLGVTAVELMPVHEFVQDAHLVERGLGNYWGYNTIGYFAPHRAYASTDREPFQVQEFKMMVRSLHAAGHRGDPGRGVQPHGRGQPPRAHALVPGRGQPLLLRGSARRTRGSTMTSRAPGTR